MFNPGLYFMRGLSTNPYGLIGYWRWENGREQITGILPKIGTASHIVGKVNNAVAFDGSTDSFLWYDHKPEFNFSDGISDKDFSIFMYINFSARANCYIVSKRENLLGSAINWAFLWYSNNLFFRKYDGNQDNYIDAIVPFIPVLNTWYFIAVTHSSTSFKVYINNVSNSTVTTNPNYVKMRNMHSNLSIASIAAIGGLRFKGKIDSMGFCNKELSVEELNAIKSKLDAGNEII